MVKYICKRCNFKTINKTKFLKHLNRKYICEAISSDVSIKEIYDFYFQDNVVLQCSNNVVKCSNNVVLCSTNVVQNIKKTDTIYTCKYCRKKFKYHSSRYNHEKKYCKKKREIEEKKEKEKDKKAIKEELKKELLEEMKEDKKKIENVFAETKESETQMVKLKNFSESDRSHLTDKDYLTAIQKGNMGIAYIIRKLYFNEKKPENHNICMTNIKNNFIRVFEEDSWQLKLASETINFLVEDNANAIEDKIAEWTYIESDSDKEDNNIENECDNPKLKHQIMDGPIDSKKKNKKKPKHKYGGEEYEEILDKFPRLLDRLSKSKYVRNLVHDEVKLVLYNNRRYALNAEKHMLDIK